MTGGALAGRRVLVVGASSGIGRAVAEGAVAAGAAVVAAARRGDAVAEIAGLARGVTADVRDASACKRIVEEALGALGGLDGLVYAPAVVALGWLVDTDSEVWHAVLETSVIGAALVTAAAMPHLEQSRGRVLYLSSDSVVRPRPGLVPYIAGKAALDTLLEGWREEVPSVTFSRIVVGPTMTPSGSGWDPALTAEMFEVWNAGNFGRYDGIMSAEEVAEQILWVLAAPVALEDVLVARRDG